MAKSGGDDARRWNGVSRASGYTGNRRSQDRKRKNDMNHTRYGGSVSGSSRRFSQDDVAETRNLTKSLATVEVLAFSWRISMLHRSRSRAEIREYPS